MRYESLGDTFANITVNQNSMVATVRLNSDDKNNPDKDVKQSAKHEAIHLLLWRLEDRANSRYILDSELCETVEELVRRLEWVIQ